MSKSRGVTLSALALFISLFALTGVANADRGFTTRFSTNDTGDIAGIANGLMTCPASVSTCAAAQNAGPTTVANSYINNNYDMTYVDTDSDSSTFDSSTANQSLPAGAQVLFAGLYWGGDYSTGTAAAPNASARNQVKFKLPGSSSYLDLTADTLDDSTLNVGRYQGFKNVTSLIQALPNAGNGTYGVANVQAGKGSDHYAGWTLVVAYRDTTQPARNLTVFDGLSTIRSSDPPTDIPVSGFLTPPAGSVKTELGFVTWEGDLGLVGDSASLNGHVLSDASHPATNFFDSIISRDGALYTDRNPAYSNALGFDATFTNADGYVGNNATSATIRVTTAGDQYLPGVITFATDIYAPKIVQTKTVSDDNGGDVEEGDTLTYTISGTNSGQDGTSGFTLRDPIPANVDYVPGSLKIATDDSAGTTGSVTDASGDDRGEYDATNNRIVARLGAGSSATAGGNIKPGDDYAVTFKVKVHGPDTNAVLPGTAIANTATATFLSQTTGTPLSATASANTSVKAPDLHIVKTRTGAAPVAGSTTQYTLAVDNVGTAKSQGTVTVSDPLPANTTATAVSGNGWTCNALPATSLTCTRSDAVAAGSAYPNIVVTVKLGSNYSGSVSNTANVAGGGDANLANNSSNDTSPSSAAVDIALAMTASQNTVNIGESFDYVLKVTNNGPSDATSVAISDPLPAGLTYVGSDGACTIEPTSGVISCPVGALASGDSKTITLHVKATSAAGNTTVTNTATAGAAQTESNTSNNSATAKVAVTGADLAVTKKLLTTDPHTGSAISYSVSVKNNGPSDATSVVLHDALPSGITGVSTDTPACTVTSGAVDCPVGALAAGDSYTIKVNGTVKSGQTVLINNASAQGAEPDPDMTNNSAQVSTPVTAVADLSLVKSADQGQVSPGDTIVYTFAVTNKGPDAASSVVVHDTLPAGLTYVDGAPGCNASGQVVTCTLKPLAAGGSEQTGISVKLTGDLHGSVTNTANVTSDTPDPDSSNNTSAVDVGILDNADVSINKTVDNENPRSGDVVTYTLKASNAGPAAAKDTTIVDTLPAGETFVSADSPCVFASGTVKCDIGTLAAGDSKTLHVKASIDPIGADNANATHDLDTQKVESQIDLDPHTTKTIAVDCPTGYVVTDGSVRLDAVDQGTGDLGSLQVNASQATSTSTWQGIVRNDANGRAQAKIFAVCVSAKTTDGAHSLIISAPVTVHQTLLAGHNEVNLACGPGTIAIDPSYRLDGDAQVSASKPNGNGWTFGLDVQEGTTADFAIRCLSEQVSVENGHTHDLHLNRITQDFSVPAGQAVSLSLTCGDNAKGIVAGWDVDKGLFVLGNDPEPKTRVFKFFNRGTTTLSGHISLLCLDMRTGGEETQTDIRNTASISTSTIEQNTDDNSDWAGLKATGADATVPAGTSASSSSAGTAPSSSTKSAAVSAPAAASATASATPAVATVKSAARATAVSVSGTTATTTVTCAKACSGTATLVASKTVKIGKTTIKKGTVLATGHYAVKAGKSAKVKLTISALGRKALKSKLLRSASLKLGGASSTVLVKH